MKIDATALDYLEQYIPEMAELATRQAFWQTLASGAPVLIAENGQLVEVSPDGNRRIIKELPAPTPVTAGQTFLLPWH